MPSLVPRLVEEKDVAGDIGLRMVREPVLECSDQIGHQVAMEVTLEWLPIRRRVRCSSSSRHAYPPRLTRAPPPSPPRSPRRGREPPAHTDGRNRPSRALA